MTLKERFMDKVEKTDNCWWWTGAIQSNGYGMIRVDGSSLLAHRVSYFLFVGGVPSDKCVLHSCDNRICVNPKHLWLGTYKDNNADCAKKGRHKSKLTPKQVQRSKELHDEGYDLEDIANEFGVSRQALYYRFSQKKP